MDNPRVFFEKNLSNLSMFRNEYITIYLFPDGSRFDIKATEKSPINLEIRITPEGKTEIYCDNDDVKLKSFKKWYDAEG